MLIILAISPQSLTALDVIPRELIPKTYTKAELLDKLYQYADTYDVSAKTMIAVINCENREWDTYLQSRIINKKGKREESYGLAQIHLPSHPHITHKQATDPDFSLEFMAKSFRAGKATWWSCYKMLA